VKATGQKWHGLSAEAVLSELDSQINGLTAAEAAHRQQEYGKNSLARNHGAGPWLIFWRQINNPIGWLLLAAGALAVVLTKGS